MKKVYKISKSRLYANADYSAVLCGGDFGGYKLTRVEPGEIEISTGAVCFFDPYNPGRGRPFSARFPAGKYRPFMLMISTSNGDRVALAGLDGGELKNAAVWRLAFTDERDALKLLSPDETVGVTVSSGFGALCDIKTFGDFAELVKSGEQTFHPLDGAVNMDGGCAQICKLKDVLLPTFNTGWGEGNYSSFIGIGEDGEIKGLICDFAMVKSAKKKDNRETEEFEFDVSAEDLYIPDPKKSDAENSIARCTMVIESGEEDVVALFNAYSRRGYSYHTAGRYDEALGDYLKAIELGRKKENAANFLMHAWSLYDNAANIYRNAGKVDDAIKLYSDACKVSDTFYGGAYAGLIDVYRDNKDYKKALEAADEMVAARPRDPSAYIKRSEICIACEEYEKAILDLDVLIDEFKLNESILDKATCLTFLGRYGEALKVLDSYLLEGRASEIYYDIRSSIHIADNDFAAAYVDAMKALDVNPDYLNTLEKLIEFDSLLFNYKNVVKWATRYTESLPRTEYGYSVRAAAYAEMGEYDEAAAGYVHIIRNINDSPKYYALLIKAAFAGGDRGLAKRYGKMLRKSDEARYIYYLGLAYLFEKKYPKAERYLASAFKLCEEDDVLSSLIDCYIESGDIDKAQAALKMYSDIAEAEEVFVKRARIAKKRGEPAAKLEKEYVNEFLCGCDDQALTEKVKAFFENLD